MTTTTQTGFINTNAARILAAALAVFFAVIWFYNYQADFGRLISGDDGSVQLPESSSQASIDQNPGLAACLEQRIGDVDQMKKDGLLSEDKYASFRARAEQLCAQQNPAQ